MSVGKDLSVSITATCADESITLHFDKPGSYRIWRKFPSEVSWGSPIWERPIGTEFVYTAEHFGPGLAIEFKVQELSTGAVGYILAGSKIPLVDNRGTLILIVERTHADALKVELAQFVQDLVGDGYTVVRHDVSRTDSPESVKAVIKAEYDADPANVKTVLLFGAIPVRLSGLVNYDGHGAIPVAADGFYADMTGDWSNGPGIFPAHLNLAVGRIDFSELTCFSNKENNPRSELDLLQQYLNRNHAFRTGQWSVTPRGAIRDWFTDRDFSSNGWRNMPQLCRDGIDEIPDGQFFSALTAKDYLLTFAAGGGQITSMDGLGGTTSGSDDFALNNIRSPFVMLLGSAFLGRWDKESNLVRSVLGSGDAKKGCLCAFGAGAPHVFLHYAGLGEPIGGSWLRSVNNFTIYPPTGNPEPGLYTPAESTGIPPCAGRVHQSLHGDPTLTLFPVAPVTELRSMSLNGRVDLDWKYKYDADGGGVAFHVYRSASPSGPFVRITPEPLSLPVFELKDHFAGLHYMVRAVKLITTPSGSYYAASCGVMWTDSQTPPMPPDPGQIMSKATFIHVDQTTKGDGIAELGDGGYYLCAGQQTPPSYATVEPAGKSDYVWSDDSQDMRALKIPGKNGRLAAVWSADIGFAVEIKSDAAAHRLAIYLIDWDRPQPGRWQRVEIMDGATGAVLDSREISNFQEGIYLVWDFAGTIKLRITKITGPNAVLSGLFFGPAGATPPVPTPGATRTLEVLASLDGGETWHTVQTTEIDATGIEHAIFKLAIR